MVSITTIIVLSGVINYANSSSYPTLTPSSYPTLTPTSYPTLTPTSYPTLTPTSYPTLTPTGGNLYDCIRSCFLRNDGKLFD